MVRCLSPQAVRKSSTATDANMGIFDLSSVTQFAASSEFIHSLARQKPARPDAIRGLRVIAVEGTVGFGLARMFQLTGEDTRPMLQLCTH
jgi:hypothetical protein